MNGLITVTSLCEGVGSGIDLSDLNEAGISQAYIPKIFLSLTEMNRVGLGQQ